MQFLLFKTVLQFLTRENAFLMELLVEQGYETKRVMTEKNYVKFQDD